MAQENSPSPSTTPPPSASERVLALVNTVTLAFILVVALGLLLLLSDLMGNTAALQAQARKTVKTVQTMRTEIAEIRDILATAEPPAVVMAEPPAVVASEQNVVPLPVAPTASVVTMTTTSPRLSQAGFRSGVGPLPICKFLPGNGSGLANCIKTKA